MTILSKIFGKSLGRKNQRAWDTFETVGERTGAATARPSR